MPGADEGRTALSRAALRLRERVSKRDPASPPTGRTAILIVNGFDRRSPNAFDADEARQFPWIRLCLQQLERHTGGNDFDVLVWDNSFLPEHLEILEADPRVFVFSEREKQKDVKHGRALDRLLREVPEETEYVVTLDTDCFPVRDGWLENLTGRLRRGASLTGVWRDEMAPRIPPYVHPSCLAARRATLLELDVEFARKQGVHRVDVGQNITKAIVSAGGRLGRLRRSNARNMHFLMAGVYGDLVYHHGAGNRRAIFWQSFAKDADEAIRVALRDAAFADLDGLIDFLTGNGPLEEPEDEASGQAAGLESQAHSPSLQQPSRAPT